MTDEKKARGANPNVDYKALFQKSKDKYDRVSSDHTDIVANIKRASAKQGKLREELDWLLDTVAARRVKTRAAEAERRARQQTEGYYPYAAAPYAYAPAYPASRYRSPSPHYHPPIRTVQDPYADHVPPPPLHAHEYYRPPYAAARHMVDPYRSASRSPPRTYARSPPGDHASAKRPRSTDPLDPRWAPDPKRPRND